MYDFIFWVVYSDNRRKSKSTWLSRSNASGIVFFALLIHVFFIIEILKKAEISYVSLKYLTNHRSIEVLIGLALMSFAFFYYNDKRVITINDRFLKNTRAKWQNRLMVVLVIFVPLLSIMIMGWAG